MGINPYRKYNVNKPIPSERYLMLYHHLNSFKKYADVPMHFHKYSEYGMFSSASQVQLDVHKDDLVKTINVFSKIDPINALLFSNSVLFGDNDNLACFRDVLWEYSTHGVNPHNIGGYDVDFKDIGDLQAYLESLNIYCVMRDGAYINFESMNLLDYFSRDYVRGEIYCRGEYRQIDVKPCVNDIKFLRPFKFIQQQVHLLEMRHADIRIWSNCILHIIQLWSSPMMLMSSLKRGICPRLKNFILK